MSQNHDKIATTHRFSVRKKEGKENPRMYFSNREDAVEAAKSLAAETTFGVDVRDNLYDEACTVYRNGNIGRWSNDSSPNLAAEAFDEMEDAGS